MTKLLDFYKADLQNKKFLHDEKQELTIQELHNLSEIIINKEKKEDNIFFSDVFKFFNKDEYLGLYIWGDVGRGKTYLVDLFYHSLEANKKLRIHYHHFMKLIYSKLKEFNGKKNPLKLVAEWFKKNYIIICLDEFFVKDIGDAMQLGNLFQNFFNLNVYFVITSNVIPNKLYDGGLQRQKFIPTINLIEKHLKIINIDGKIDYRYKNYDKENVFFSPISFNSFKSMKRLFLKLATHNISRKKKIEIHGRNIQSLYSSGTLVWFDFNNLCGDGRSQLDYIELSSIFDTFFISGIKNMNKKNEDIAKRFILLIDELYDKKINIVISTESEIDKLYTGEILKFDFKRTISRLNEMSTSVYLKDFDKNVF